jgi:phage regulator Rha-like protein
MTKHNSTQHTTAIQAITFNNADKITMSSREIAELTEKEHKNVTRVIRDLISDGALGAQIEPLKFEYRGQWFDYYELNKRDSIVVVARLKPKFMAMIVDRWIELEKQVAQVKASRLDGKEARKLETDAIKDLVEYAEASGSKSANMYYANITRMTNSILGIESGQRDNLTVKQLDQVRIAETMVKMAISDGLEQSIPYKEIYKLCKDRVSSIAQVLLN